MERYILGIDIGTTSVKALLISESGALAAEGKADHDLISAHPGWAEENAEVWWSNAVAAVRQITDAHPDMAENIVSAGVSGMVPALVLLDHDGKPVRNTIQQNDARAVAQIEKLTALLDQDELYERTGTRTNQQHVLPRLLWVKENEPEVFARSEYVVGSYEFVTGRMTGARYIESNWAVESGLYDIRRQCWMTEQFSVLGVDKGYFPPVIASHEKAGNVTQEAAALMGIPAGIPVISGSADHVASTLAAGIVKPGDLLIKFGGAGDILFCTGDIQTSDKLFFDYHIVPGKYLLNGCMAASGSLSKWFVKDILHSIDPDIFKKLDKEAAKVPPASDGLVILPYFLGEKTPLFDPSARGVMFGLTLSHTPGHIFRAILEAVIYGFKHHIDVLAEMGYTPGRIFATNGGSKSSFWCQIAADVLGAHVTSFPKHPGSALGVAFLAGVHAGVFRDFEEIQKFLVSGAQEYDPIEENAKIYRKSYQIYRELYQELRPSFAAVQRLYD